MEKSRSGIEKSTSGMEKSRSGMEKSRSGTRDEKIHIRDGKIQIRERKIQIQDGKIQILDRKNPDPGKKNPDPEWKNPDPESGMIQIRDTKIQNRNPGWKKSRSGIKIPYLASTRHSMKVVLYWDRPREGSQSFPASHSVAYCPTSLKLLGKVYINLYELQAATDPLFGG